jgi:glucan biosynthesis protein C
MDALRGALMALGVLLHSSQVYNPDNNWLIHSSLSVPAARDMVNVIHLFRMPAFFIVAGFFCLLTIRKYGSGKFLKLRVERVLIPLFVTAITLNMLQTWLLDASGSIIFEPFSYLRKGEWVSHLWFLIDLFVFVLATYIGAVLMARIPPKTLACAKQCAECVSLEFVLLVLPFSYLAILAIAKVEPSLYEKILGLFSVYELLYYFQFFCFGIALHWLDRWFNRFTQFSFVRSGTFIVIWALVNASTSVLTNNIYLVLDAYADSLLIWIGCYHIFAVFKMIADRPSNFSRFVASVSYTVYLFHHLLVIAFGLLFIRLEIGGSFGLALLSAIVLLCGILIDATFVSRFNWASYLYNGIRLQDRPWPAQSMKSKVERPSANRHISSP